LELLIEVGFGPIVGAVVPGSTGRLRQTPTLDSKAILMRATQPGRVEAARGAPLPPSLPQGRFQRGGHVDQAQHAGTIILFDKRTYYTLPNETANDLWALLAEPRTAEELVARLHETYDAPREVIARDIAHQLAHYRAHGLVVEIGPDGEPVRAPRPWWRPWRRG
jgi:hypothetical protein